MTTKRRGFLVLIGAAIVLIALAMLVAPAARALAQAGSPQSQAEHRRLFLRGAQLWPIYCNTCHNARPASEFSPAEWNMIMTHMRTQANLTAEDALAIREYLKAAH